MPYRKRTLRQMPPRTRKLARLVGDLEGTVRAIKNLLPAVQTMELLERAEAKRKQHFQEDAPIEVEDPNPGSPDDPA